MKKTTITFLLAITAIFTVASCCGGKTDTGTQPEGITKADIDSVSYMMGYSFGMQLKEGNFGPLNYSDINRGMRDASKGVEVDVSEFRRIVGSFMDIRHKALAEEMIARSEKYLEEKRQEEGVDSTMSGLLYKIIENGHGPQPTPLDTVEVNYEGINLDGKVFDSSYERGTSAKFPLNGVIKAWTEGIQMISEGGTIMLYAPAKLAYGEYGNGANIRPNEAITFKVELIKVHPFIPRENK